MNDEYLLKQIDDLPLEDYQRLEEKANDIISNFEYISPIILNKVDMTRVPDGVKFAEKSVIPILPDVMLYIIQTDKYLPYIILSKYPNSMEFKGNVDGYIKQLEKLEGFVSEKIIQQIRRSREFLFDRIQLRLMAEEYKKELLV